MIKIDEAKKRTKRNKKLPYSSIGFTTGDIDFNIDRFNTLMGTADSKTSTETDNSSSDAPLSADSLGEAYLNEAKRYVRRYYVRPFNIFASNKAEIIKILIDHKNQNCTIYTLNNLGDEKDVTKLMNSDIIYYYDEGILYDKNHIRIMDYDLGIKREENRKKFSKKVDDSSAEFQTEYEDRMTATTGFDESFHINEESLIDVFADCSYSVIDAGYTDAEDSIIVSLNHNVSDIEAAANELEACLAKVGIKTLDWNTNGNNVFIFQLDQDNAFDLNFDDINAYGEYLTEAKTQENICCICGEPIEGYGNNPEPFLSAVNGQCCASCNLHFVIPARMEQMKEN